MMCNFKVSKLWKTGVEWQGARNVEFHFLRIGLESVTTIQTNSLDDNINQMFELKNSKSVKQHDYIDMFHHEELLRGINLTRY
jgi:hypothetical protein